MDPIKDSEDVRLFERLDASLTWSDDVLIRITRESLVAALSSAEAAEKKSEEYLAAGLEASDTAIKFQATILKMEKALSDARGAICKAKMRLHSMYLVCNLSPKEEAEEDEDIFSKTLPCEHIKRIEIMEKDLADARGMVCRAREVWNLSRTEGMIGCHCNEEDDPNHSHCPLDAMDAALSSSSPCPHAERVGELECQNKQLTEYIEKGVAFRDELQARCATLEQAIKKIYTTQMYEDKKKESGVSVGMVSAILEAAEKAGCRA